MDQNLQESVADISTYFETLAKFDQDIAQADVGYIDGKLKEFRAKNNESSREVKQGRKHTYGDSRSYTYSTIDF